MKERRADLGDLGARIGQIADRLGGRGRLAEVVDVSPAQLFRYLKNESEPNASTLVAMARAGRVRLEWLMLGEGPPDLPPPEQASYVPVSPEDFEVLQLCRKMGLDEVLRKGRRSPEARLARLLEMMTMDPRDTFSLKDMAALLEAAGHPVEPGALNSDYMRIVKLGLGTEEEHEGVPHIRIAPDVNYQTSRRATIDEGIASVIERLMMGLRPRALSEEGTVYLAQFSIQTESEPAVSRQTLLLNTLRELSGASMRWRGNIGVLAGIYVDDNGTSR